MKTKKIELDVFYAVANTQDVLFDESGYMYALSAQLSDDVLKNSKEEAEDLLETLKEKNIISFDNEKELQVVKFEFSVKATRL